MKCTLVLEDDEKQIEELEDDMKDPWDKVRWMYYPEYAVLNAQYKDHPGSLQTAERPER